MKQQAAKGWRDEWQEIKLETSYSNIFILRDFIIKSITSHRSSTITITYYVHLQRDMHYKPWRCNLFEILKIKAARLYFKAVPWLSCVLHIHPDSYAEIPVTRPRLFSVLWPAQLIFTPRHKGVSFASTWPKMPAAKWLLSQKDNYKKKDPTTQLVSLLIHLGNSHGVLVEIIPSFPKPNCAAKRQYRLSKPSYMFDHEWLRNTKSDTKR